MGPGYNSRLIAHLLISLLIHKTTPFWLVEHVTKCQKRSHPRACYFSLLPPSLKSNVSIFIQIKTLLPSHFDLQSFARHRSFRSRRSLIRAPNFCLRDFVPPETFQFQASSSPSLSSNSSFSSSFDMLCPYDQSHVLLQFKNSFSIDPSASENCSLYSECYFALPYPKTELWKEDTDCYLWDGVTYEFKTGYVIGLDLWYLPFP